MNLSKVFNVQHDKEIRSIMFDSRKKNPDSIFFAMKGKINDGHRFIDQAIENGAVAIVYTDEIEQQKDGIAYIRVKDATEAYVSFCNAFYDYPTKKMNTIGITGTNGKTTIAWIIRSIISEFVKCGSIGTMGYCYGEEIIDSSMNLTTPKSDELFRIGKEMVDNGCQVLVLEASSEGLLTHRLDQVRFSTAVFNNLTSDHMDIHNDMESYFKAKCILFDMLDHNGKAIINIDDPYGIRLLEQSKNINITYGIKNDADYKADHVCLFNDHSEFDLLHDGAVYHIRTNLLAEFNIYNLLAVIAVLNENGYEIEKILPYLESLDTTPGRCQLIDAGQDFNVVVDYAFTPNSFEKVFAFAKSITAEDKNIIAVFGASGDRDHLRRPGTALIADKEADTVILTYDDPSTEDMMQILQEMKTYFRRLDPEIILDRFDAIKKAVSIAKTGDTILLLGKGNDTFFLDQNGRIPYISDKTAAEKAIELKKKG
ncbi:MAG: UDP-N-acetylmuramoyl-L-alanyl-D-glutamate--2,6-diaminopimelate ligase, partial [Erysipelotrichaceae bacterium]|nr:UDP-N-acetylmuramoyl-L-alanyl-D-glutamate--2,6-diaminopimelate ligase [Erysipelotrichaceae bacterium]